MSNSKSNALPYLIGAFVLLGLSVVFYTVNTPAPEVIETTVDSTQVVGDTISIDSILPQD